VEAQLDAAARKHDTERWAERFLVWVAGAALTLNAGRLVDTEIAATYAGWWHVLSPRRGTQEGRSPIYLMEWSKPPYRHYIDDRRRIAKWCFPRPYGDLRG
jgi:hypothetical protein